MRRYRPLNAATPKPKPSGIDINRALLDPNLLGAALGNPSTWSRWLAVLRAAFALDMSDADLALFKEVAGDRNPPDQRVDELWFTVGRRSGKSRVAAALACYAALLVPRPLAHGEVGVVLVLAASQDQARVVFNYTIGFLRASPVLAREIISNTATEIRLRNGNTIAIHANSFRTVRGRTLLAAIFDEVAMWRDAESALPDVETYRAVVPALATTQGMLIGISSPYRKTGLLFEKHRHYFGANDPRVLVVQGPSRAFNPTIDEALIGRALETDPESARAEWLGEFRTDISSFLDEEIIERVVDHARPLEIPPRQGLQYSAFVDPSGGRKDAFCIAIGHKEGLGDGAYYVVDVLRGRYPPFDPASVVEEYSNLLKAYHVHQVTGDNYAAEWAANAFVKQGIKYVRSEMNKSQLYLEALPFFMRQNLSIPNHAKLIRELRLLERRTSRMGRDIVDHGVNGSDDHANSLAGCLRCLTSSVDLTMSWVDGAEDENASGKQSHAAAMLVGYLWSQGIPV